MTRKKKTEKTAPQQYGWVHGRAKVSGPGSAQRVGERFEALQRHGPLTPKAVVDDARSAPFIYGTYFQWDDRIAGERWREEQASQLIRAIRIVTIDSEGETVLRHAFVNVIEGNSRGYVTSVRAMTDAVLAEQVLATALRELEALRRRYADLQELADIFRALDRVLIRQKRSSVQIHPQP